MSPGGLKVIVQSVVIVMTFRPLWIRHGQLEYKKKVMTLFPEIFEFRLINCCSQSRLLVSDVWREIVISSNFLIRCIDGDSD